MDKKVQDVVSNSQNDKYFIVRICVQGAAGDRFKLELSDGSFFCVSADFLLVHKLTKNLPLDSNLLEKVKEEDLLLSCKGVATGYLLRREHSALELERKLRAKQFSPRIIEKSLEDLSRNNLLDEKRFALHRVSSRLRAKPQGRSALVADLVGKGISFQQAKKLVYEEVGEEEERIALQRAFQKLSGKAEKSRDKVIQSLLRKGFEYRLIQTLFAEGEEE